MEPLTIILIIIAVIAVIAAFIGGYLLQQRFLTEKIKSREAEVAQRIAEAEAQAKEIVLKAKDDTLKQREDIEAENKKKRTELGREDERLRQNRERLDRRMEQVENRERNLDRKEKEQEKKAAGLAEIEKKKLTELERVSALTSEEAKQLLLKEVEKDTRADAARVIREIEDQARAEGEARAREIITTAIERIASDQVVESTVAFVPLPNDEMKGRIIGKQGRNIRALEQATGVDLVVDDTPEAVIISSHNPVRREIARISLTRLMSDGRIQPGRIEKLVEQAEKDVNETIMKAGEQALLELNLGALHPEIVKLLGSLKYRTSYGQNVLAHLVECSHLAGMIAAEIKADVKVAKMGALLHDIGKAVTHEVGGAHALIGADIARKYGVPEVVCNIIASHHGEEEPRSVEAILAVCADAISGARPGARRESLEQYLKRVESLEAIANEFPGVNQAYAIQAGREVRVIVKPEQIDDLSAINMAKQIARKIEDNLEYPGQIRVTVIREKRASEYAK